MYFNSFNNSSQNIENKKILIGDEDCTLPTYNNQFMNINVITDNPKKNEACKSWDNNTLKADIKDKYNVNLYRDVADLYGKNNSQRQYYTMPSTTIPNDQTAFAKWCYNTGPTCKEKTLYCAPPFSVVNDTTNVYKEVLFDGVSASSVPMVAGNTYVFDQSDSSNAGVSLKVAASVRNSGDDELSDADSVYTLEGTPGSAGAKTTVNFAPALATSDSGSA